MGFKTQHSDTMGRLKGVRMALVKSSDYTKLSGNESSMPFFGLGLQYT